MKDCRDCRTYKDCEGHIYIVDTEAGKQYVSWFHYGEIRWCVFQVLFIIEHSVTLWAGNWPTNPEGSGYIDPGIKTGYSSEGYYIKPVGILGEVEYRRKRTGTDGKLLKEQVENGKDITMLEPESRSALMYIKGWRRKKINYKRWLREVYNAPKTGKKHQFQ